MDVMDEAPSSSNLILEQQQQAEKARQAAQAAIQLNNWKMERSSLQNENKKLEGIIASYKKVILQVENLAIKINNSRESLLNGGQSLKVAYNGNESDKEVTDMSTIATEMEILRLYYHCIVVEKINYRIKKIEKNIKDNDNEINRLNGLIGGR